MTVLVPGWGRWLVYGWAWALVEPLACLLTFEAALRIGRKESTPTASFLIRSFELGLDHKVCTASSFA
jgi:hypothetical protein